MSDKRKPSLDKQIKRADTIREQQPPKAPKPVAPTEQVRVLER